MRYFRSVMITALIIYPMLVTSLVLLTIADILYRIGKSLANFGLWLDTEFTND